jgi:hypothetical protein
VVCGEMKRDELKMTLERERVNPRFYSISGVTGAPIDDQCVLREDKGKWMVYYFERGQKTSLRIFESEHEACQYFLEWVLSVPELRLKEKV